MEQLANESAEILIGDCVRTKSERHGRLVVTLAKILVTETFKGAAAAGTEMTVVLPGGTYFNGKFSLGMNYPGAPLIHLNEQVLLFLTPQVGGGCTQCFLMPVTVLESVSQA